MTKFKLGTRTRNDRGWYTVVSTPNKAGKMSVRYDTGEVAELLAVLELTNHRLSHALNPAIIRNEDYYIAIGFLAANSFILARMGNGQLRDFEAQYLEWTGESFNPDYSESVDNKWGLELRITFPKHLFEHVPNTTFEQLKAERQNDDYRCQITSVGWVQELLNLGFRAGNNHNTQEILKNIPEMHRDAFTIGYDIASGLRCDSIVETLRYPVRVYRQKATVETVAASKIEEVHRQDISAA